MLYCDMGRKSDAYHDIPIRRIEKLKNICIVSELSIWPKTRVSKIDHQKKSYVPRKRTLNRF